MGCQDGCKVPLMRTWKRCKCMRSCLGCMRSYLFHAVLVFSGTTKPWTQSRPTLHLTPQRSVWGQPDGQSGSWNTQLALAVQCTSACRGRKPQKARCMPSWSFLTHSFTHSTPAWVSIGVCREVFTCTQLITGSWLTSLPNRQIGLISPAALDITLHH